MLDRVGWAVEWSPWSGVRYHLRRVFPPERAVEMRAEGPSDVDRIFGEAFGRNAKKAIEFQQKVTMDLFLYGDATVEVPRGILHAE